MRLTYYSPMKVVMLAAIVFLATGTAHAQNNRTLVVSFQQLLSRPEAYDGKKIFVFGFLHVKFEDSALYMSKTDADFINGENSLWVSYDSDVKLQHLEGKDIVGGTRTDLEYFDGRYVRLGGTFNMKSHGHMGMFFGALEHCSLLTEARQWFDGRRQVTTFDKRGRIVPNRKSR